MSKVNVVLLYLLFFFPRMVCAQVPSATMAQKMEAACTRACHGPSLIAQQRLDVAGWTREMNKMMGWGAEIAEADKDGIIRYLAATFNNNRPRAASSRAAPAGKAKDVFQISCLSCHDAMPIIALKTDRAGWARAVERMTNWGAYIPVGRREDLIEYLLTNFSR